VTDASTPASPPSLRWENYPANVGNEHWRFLIARHGRGINACMADGSARWVPLEETYMLTWKSVWNKYRLTLSVY
jgi:prepilin-type processing-associated H-X9-DG protein